jgi:hypothetical protein
MARGDIRRIPLVAALRAQATSCAGLGARVSASILRATADACSRSALDRAGLPPHVRRGDLVGLRLLAAVHASALADTGHPLRDYLPTTSGTNPADDLDSCGDLTELVRDSLTADPDRTAWFVSSPPQTNDPNRAALLRLALAGLPASRPVQLHELGAAAGLNLMVDVLPDADRWSPGPIPPIVTRTGCDTRPLDPVEHRLALEAYIWPDHPDRLRYLRRALAVGRQHQPHVASTDVVDFARSIHLVEGTTTVVWHSALWRYLSTSTRASLRRQFHRLGRAATPSAGFAVMSWEPSGRRFVLSSRRWQPPASLGDTLQLATGDPHGRNVTLIADAARAPRPTSAQT